MVSDLREQDILGLRDRMINRRPGLRRSFGRFLRDFEKYTEAMDGDSTTSNSRKTPQQAEYGQRGFRA